MRQGVGTARQRMPGSTSRARPPVGASSDSLTTRSARARAAGGGAVRSGGTPRYTTTAFAEPPRLTERVTYETASAPSNRAGSKVTAPSPAR